MNQLHVIVVFSKIDEIMVACYKLDLI